MNVAQPLPAERSPRAKKRLARLRPDRLPGILPPKLLALLLAAFAFCSPAAPAQTTIHVPADQPTIQAGINAAQNGDTVLVAPGTYNENIDFKGKNITVTSGATSSTGAGATIIQAPTGAPSVIFQNSESPAATLNGFTVTHVSTIQTTNEYPGSGVVINGAAPTITNNILLDNQGCGLAALNPPSLLLQGNEIHARGASECGSAPGTTIPLGDGPIVVSGGGQSGAIQIRNNLVTGYHATINFSTSGYYERRVLVESVADVVLEGNQIYGNSGADGSILVYEAHSVNLIQNLIYGNTNESVVSGGDPEVVLSTTPGVPFSAEVINNTFVAASGTLPSGIPTPGQAFAIGGNVASEQISNNIFVGASPGQSVDCTYEAANFQSAPPPATAVFSHNDVFDGTTAQTYGCAPANNMVGNISVNPAFIDQSGGNLRTQMGSPVVAAGDFMAPLIPPADLDSKARTVCGTIDMGAYEQRPRPRPVVMSSSNPSVGGTPVTFTADVPGNCNVPTGTVTFNDGAAPLGTQPLSPGATASLTTSALLVGSHNISASYPGDFNFDPSTSPILTQTVTGFPTTLTCTASPNPAFSIGFIASATAQSAFGTPTGIVTFTVSGSTSQTTVQTRPLLNGFTNILLANPGPGTYTVTGTYSGDTRFIPSTCTVSETGIGIRSNTTLGASPNPASLGQTVTFTAGVTAAGNSNTTPTGTVVFTEGATTLASVALNGTGAAAFTTSTLSVGSHTITASYSGDKTYSPGNASVTETILITGTATTLTATPNPAAPGQAVTLAAKVTPASPTAVAGMVTFLDNGKPLGTAPVSANGTATFTTSTLALGSHPITATFAAGGGLGSSTSATITEQIIAPTFTLTLQPAQLALLSGSSGTVQVQLAAVGGYTGTLALRTGALPDYVTASFQPAAVTLPPGGAVSSTLTLNTPAITAQRRPAPSARGGEPVALAAALFLVPFGWRRRRFATRAAILCFTLLALGSSGCTDVRYPIHIVQPGTYLVPVTAADVNGNAQTATLQLIIKP